MPPTPKNERSRENQQQDDHLASTLAPNAIALDPQALLDRSGSSALAVPVPPSEPSTPLITRLSNWKFPVTPNVSVSSHSPSDSLLEIRIEGATDAVLLRIEKPITPSMTPNTLEASSTVRKSSKTTPFTRSTSRGSIVRTPNTEERIGRRMTLRVVGPDGSALESSALIDLKAFGVEDGDESFKSDTTLMSSIVSILGEETLKACKALEEAKDDNTLLVPPPLGDRRSSLEFGGRSMTDAMRSTTAGGGANLLLTSDRRIFQEKVRQRLEQQRERLMRIKQEKGIHEKHPMIITEIQCPSQKREHQSLTATAPYHGDKANEDEEPPHHSNRSSTVELEYCPIHDVANPASDQQVALNPCGDPPGVYQRPRDMTLEKQLEDFLLKYVVHD